MPPQLGVANKPAIVMTPPVQSQPSAHPRRPPAHRSVSLLHSPRPRTSPPNDRSDSSSDSHLLTRRRDAAKKDSPSSLQPLGQHSSGESSSAEKWFEKSNNEVRGTGVAFADDPPFFMQNSSSSETPPEVQQLQQLLRTNDGSQSLPLRASLLQLGTDASSTEDFRSVIDDLTIENKKLKRRLKKFEKLHDSHLKDEKLFEVRIHGLPAEKKHELEEMLRKFTAGLGTTSFPSNGYDGLLPLLNPQKTTSSQTSLQNADSAYASMSASGQGSATHYGQETKQSKHAQVAASRHQNIHSYLHQIPQGLFAQTNPATMTERAKKKMVVRRLEQIFAGKGAVGGHQHPLQQQEVSRIAAHADQVASEAQGQKYTGEGTRIASFMLKELHDPAHPVPGVVAGNTSPDGNGATDPAEKTGDNQQSGADSSNVEQRPTRPLDLDPNRAQVPSENIDYMRRLGFSPPDPGKRPEDGHGWIYLNILINMAQLHTINVTAEFVRKALSEYSSKFELSSDGRKIRWKGGRNITRGSSSSGGDSQISSAGLDTPDGQSPRKRLKTGHGTGARSSSGRPGRLFDNRMVYTPLFFHKDSDDAEESSSDEDDSMSSPFPAPVPGDSSGMTSSGVRTITIKKQKKHDDGPIIFYNNARFCTDLSGERKPQGNANAPPYVPASTVAIGQPQNKSSVLRFERRGPLDKLSHIAEAMELSDNPIPDHLELSFPRHSPPKQDLTPEIEPVAMEATGIGGVIPADNFAISVESRFALIQNQEGQPSVSSRPNATPPKLARILLASRSKKRPAPIHREDILSVRKRDLPPSTLPTPVSFMPFGEESMSDDEFEEDDAMSESPESPGAMPPSTAPQPVELTYISSEDEGEEEDEEDDDGSESDGSLDLLAVAREVDPEAIRAREREYDANMAERLAEEIPAGSSAATAGGGSGFASPADGGMNREEYRKALRDARAKMSADQKSAKTVDSMVVEAARAELSDEEQAGSEDEDMSVKS